MRKRWFLIAPLAIAGFAVFIAIGGQVVMYLWNWLMPDLFGWRSVTFWQALGLLALSRILFGGFGGGGFRGGRSRRRWERLSPEERERLGQGFAERAGCAGPDDRPRA